MSLSAWAIRNPVAPMLAFALLLLLGARSFDALPITRFPTIDAPIVSVVVTHSGAAPAELESQIAKPIEDAVAGVPGVQHIDTKITEGRSGTTVSFRLETSVIQATQDVKEAVERVRGDLPAAIDPPMTTSVDIEAQAIQTFAVFAPGMTLEELSWFVDDQIIRSLQGLPGVGRVDRLGGGDRAVRVALNEDRLNAIGVTAAAVTEQLRRMNLDRSSGRSLVDAGEQAIRVLGDAGDVDQLAALTIASPGGRIARLADLGQVADGCDEPSSFAAFNGRPVVAFAVFRARGAGDVGVAATIAKTLDAIRAQRSDVAITLIDDAAAATERSYHATLNALIEGALLAVLVVTLFLRDGRATLIAAVALPLSAVPTFWVMELLGFSLNLISLLALTLATGVLVDDAIVEIENIERHLKMGKSPYRAAMDAADEIGLAVIATSLAIIAVFLPVSLMPGMAGRYFSQFGLTVAVCVFFSLLVARLITPVMAASVLRPIQARQSPGDDHDHAMTLHTALLGVFLVSRWITPAKAAALMRPAQDRRRRGDSRVMTLYLALIGATTRRRYATMLVAVGLLVVSLYALLQIPGSFMPPEETGRVTLSVELPPGATLADTERATMEIYNRIKDLNGVSSVFALGGASPSGDLETRRAAVAVQLDPRDTSLVGVLTKVAAGRTKSQAQIETDILERVQSLPDLRVFKVNDKGERDLSFNLLSEHAADLEQAAARLETMLRDDPLIAHLSLDGATLRSELQIRPRNDHMARLGVTTEEIAQIIRIATIGDYGAELAKITLDGRLIPIRVQLQRDFAADLAAIRALKILTGFGTMVPVSSVADIDFSDGPSAIRRYDRRRVVVLGADLPVGVALDQAADRFKEIAAAADAPATVRLVESGDLEQQAEALESFGDAMLLGVTMVLALLILLFKDLAQPFTILFSLPLAIGGAAAGLILTQHAVSLPVLIGFVMLMGVVGKNAILLVDCAVAGMRDGLERTAAILEAGRKRARPIVMTSLAMSAGMVPSAFGVGEGGSFRAPMAVAVIGGVVASTVLSLVVVPALFLVMDDCSRLFARLWGRWSGERSVRQGDG